MRKFQANLQAHTPWVQLTHVALGRLAIGLPPLVPVLQEGSASITKEKFVLSMLQQENNAIVALMDVIELTPQL
jgi:hypothetical protein